MNLNKNKAYIEEFKLMVKDIVLHPEFQKQKNIRHHKGNVYHHSLIVGFLSYKITKKIGKDYLSAARGGVLHDFFLYDWQLDDDAKTIIKGFKHLTSHSKKAVNMANSFFKLNRKEEDIILKHMFPLTIWPPIFIESLIVSIIDTYVAILEFIKPSFKYRYFDIV